MLKPCIQATGPKDAKLVLIGEAPGAQEELAGVPFVGYSGQELDRMLLEAGILRRECYLTNVLFTRPPDNKFDALLVKKKELPDGYSLPPVSQGRYLPPEFVPELDRLHAELRTVRPNLIVALGAKALWACIGKSTIGAMRGAVCETPFGKLLATYHPAAMLRDWSLRPIIVADLIKASHERTFPHIIRPVRMVIKDPTFSEIEEYYLKAKEAEYMAVDIETKNRRITAIGFAISKVEALHIPFYKPHPTEPHYWSEADERLAWRWVARLLSLPAKKIFQNGLYDLQYLFKMGLRVVNCAEDTMLMHHALYPELPKSLGFMGSIYTNEAAWKLMRKGQEEKAND
jgi:DNA polymerase